MMALIGGGLFAFGYIVHSSRKADTSRMARMPVAVAAVRGSQGDAPTAALPASEVVVDYTRALQADVALARKNAGKFEDATEDRMAEARKALTAGE